MTTTTTDTVEAIEGFIGHDGKEERVFRTGDLAKADDPAVKKWPHLFGPPTLGTNARIEQARAGNRRA